MYPKYYKKKLSSRIKTQLHFSDKYCIFFVCFMRIFQLVVRDTLFDSLQAEMTAATLKYHLEYYKSTSAHRSEFQPVIE